MTKHKITEKHYDIAICIEGVALLVSMFLASRHAIANLVVVALATLFVITVLSGINFIIKNIRR